jgi:uncharacterized protein YgiM (DUF1202 family)
MIWRFENIKEGVVLEQSIDVRSGPGDDNPVLFTIHTGLKAEIRTDTAGWYQIVLLNGWNGWVPGEAMGVIQRDNGDSTAAYEGTGGKADG